MNNIATLALLLLTLGSTWAYPQDYIMDGPGDYEYDDENAEEESNLDYNNLAFPTFTVEKQTYPVQEGGAVNISCAVNGTTPYVRIIKKVGEEGKQDQILFVGDVEVKISNKNKYSINNGIMTIRNVNRNDAGQYLCYFEADPVVELTHTLDVQYAPNVHITSPTSKNQRVVKGDSVTLECEAYGNPIPKKIWSRVGGRLPSGYEEEEGYSMTLEDVDRHVQGTYTCKADNGIGKPVTDEIEISVEYAPEIITEKAIIHTGEDDKVELVCIVHSRPSSKVIWQKDGNSITDKPNLVESQGGHRHTLMLEKITKEMFGDYTCNAKNSYGEAEGIINLTDLPKAPHFTSDPNGGEETSYTLTFDSESYYPITEYQIKFRMVKANSSSEWKDLGSMNVKDVDSTEKNHSLKYTIDGLEEATDYEVVAATKNKNKWGNESSFFFSTKKDKPQGRTAASGSSSIMGASTSILVIAVTLLLNH